VFYSGSNHILTDNRKGIFFVIGAMTILAIQDVLIKLVSDELSLFQIQFFRSTIGIAVIIGYQVIIHEPIRLTTAYPLLTVCRGLMFFFGYSAFYFAQSKMPIATMTVLFLVSPFFITLTSIYFFKSQVGYRRWISILIGFVGVVLICQPETGQFNFYYLIPIIVALSYAFSVIIVKKTADRDTLYQQMILTYLIMGLLSGITGLLFGDGRFDTAENSEITFIVRSWQFVEIESTFKLFAISVLGSVGLLVLMGAYRVADPAVISPYEYSLLIWMILLGYLVWGDVPSFNIAIGMVLIVGAGIYIFYRERIKSESVDSDTSVN
jgi:drug/metabolite transporter (DMT)-like permease|tara:strand:- start:557 stop:1525 length:969 start_codon:yes stop_codon:yes gene_type:complete